MCKHAHILGLRPGGENTHIFMYSGIYRYIKDYLVKGAMKLENYRFSVCNKNTGWIKEL